MATDPIGARPGSRAGQVLTTINLALPALVLVVFVAHRFSRDTVLDRVAPVVFWLWLAASPVVGGLAIRRARRDGAKRLVWLNIVVLALWALLLLGSLLLH
jgi:chromate transport protein ChrA